MKNEPTGGVNTLSYLKQSKMIFYVQGVPS